MSVEKNVASRELAELLIATIDEAIEEEGEAVDPMKVWTVIAAISDERAGVLDSVERIQEQLATGPAVPMRDEESRNFGRLRMPDKFKKFAGKRIDEVPVSYLRYIVDNADVAFIGDLERYLDSDRVQMEEREED